MSYKIEEFLVKTNKGKVSWKKTALNLLKVYNKEIEFHKTPSRIPRSEGYCPRCGADLLELGNEIFCENESCSFDKILSSDMWLDFIEKYNVPCEK